MGYLEWGTPKVGVPHFRVWGAKIGGPLWGIWTGGDPCVGSPK